MRFRIDIDDRAAEKALKELRGMGTRRYRAWSEKVCAALSEGRVDNVLRELRPHAATDHRQGCRLLREQPRRCATRATARWGCWLDRAWSSSRGTLVAARFKRGRMRWSKAGAYDPLLLRACVQRTVRRLLASAARAPASCAVRPAR